MNTGGTCTSHADCCTGLPCVIPTGAAVGTCGSPPTGVDAGGGTDGGGADGGDGGAPPTCALYGQTCTKSADCCDGVPCTGGTCRYP
jgi:hypothetical protein